MRVRLEVQMIFQSTPSVWRETSLRLHVLMDAAISIHSLRVEGDYWVLAAPFDAGISIHSLRVEGDAQYREIEFDRNHFNPLPPCGGRRKKYDLEQMDCAFQSTPSVWRETQAPPPPRSRREFQSTPSVWRETKQKIYGVFCKCISIHSLRVEGDPPSPWQDSGAIAISIHSLRVEGDCFRQLQDCGD